MNKSVVTIKTLPATNTQGTRIKISTEYGSKVLSWDYSACGISKDDVVKSFIEIMNKVCPQESLLYRVENATVEILGGPGEVNYGVVEYDYVRTDA